MIKSEILNPAFGHILDELTKDVADAPEEGVVSACQNLWLATDAINNLTCCFRNGGEFASVAISNERRKIADYIKFKIGVDPILEKEFAKW